MSLTPDERQRIYEEEKARMAARHQLAEEQSTAQARTTAYGWLGSIGILVSICVRLLQEINDHFLGIRV